MKKVIFLKDTQGSIDGYNVKNFNKDCIYNVDGVEINDYLFKSWINKEILKEVKEEKMLPEFENKAIFSISENKEIKNKKKIKNNDNFSATS